jgi:UDP-N-acetylglucosamine 2-epimerase (non-hydrolysing)
MLRQALESFHLEPDIDLDLMQPNQSLATLTGVVIAACHNVFETYSPDRVIVQGDTTTAFGAALAAYYGRIPVAHVEAGLRTNHRYNPFPEEMNRRLVASLADIHFAPTPRAVRQLQREGVDRDSIFLTGNTVVDALEWLRAHTSSEDVSNEVRELVAANPERLVLITSHRRESFGAQLSATLEGVARLALAFPDRTFFFPVHLNPNLRAQVLPRLHAVPNIILSDPVSYVDLLHVMSAAELIITDSGGIQEEAPSFGTPVIVLRRFTERPEGMRAGFSRLVPPDEQQLMHVAKSWLKRGRRRALVGRSNPFGDGKAADRIVAALEAAHSAEHTSGA